MPPPNSRGKQEVERSTQNKQRNMFSVLADSDSEEDTSSPAPNIPFEPLPLPPPIQAPEIQEEVDSIKPSFRTWVHEEENRFKHEDMKKNIFSSPFSKGKKMMKQWSRPRFKENEEGWTSIRWSQPQFQDEEEDFEKVSVIYEARVSDTQEEYPSIGNTKSARPIEDIWNQKEEEVLSAVAWAERIKRSLEKAELSRLLKAKESRTVDQPDFKESLSRLSFFRRPVSEMAEIVLSD